MTDVRIRVRRPVGLLAVGAFAIGTDMFVVAGILGALAADLHVPLGTAGLAVAVFGVAYGVGTVLLGALLGARPLRQVLIGAQALYALCTVAAAAAPSLSVLLAARVLGGLAASAYLPAAGAATVASVPPSHRGRALAMLLGGGSASVVLGAPLGVVLAGAVSWRAAFALVATLAAATAAGLLCTRVASVRLPRADLRERLRPAASRAVVAALAVTFLVGAGSNSSFTYLAALTDGVPLGLLIGVFGAGGVLGTWWGGVASDRWGGRTVVLAAAVVLGACLAATAGSLPPLLLACWGLAGWALFAGQQHRLSGFTAGPATLLLALNSSAHHLGVATGALLGGLIVDAGGAPWPFAVACCAAAVAILRARTGEG